MSSQLTLTLLLLQYHQLDLNIAQIGQKDKLFQMVSLELQHSQKLDSIAFQIFTTVHLLKNHGHKTLFHQTLELVKQLMVLQLTLNTAQTDLKDKLFQMVLQELLLTQNQDLTALVIFIMVLFLNHKNHGHKTSSHQTLVLVKLLTLLQPTLNTAQTDQKDKHFKTVSQEPLLIQNQDTTALVTSTMVLSENIIINLFYLS